MSKFQIALIILLCISIVVFVVGCRGLIKARREKRKFLRQVEENRQHQEEEYQAWRGTVYAIHLCLEKHIESYVQRAQMRTKTESPEAVAYQALELYIDLIELYSQGYRLFIGQPSPTQTRLYRFHCESLDRVEKKTES